MRVLLHEGCNLIRWLFNSSISFCLQREDFNHSVSKKVFEPDCFLKPDTELKKTMQFILTFSVGEGFQMSPTTVSITFFIYFPALSHFFRDLKQLWTFCWWPINTWRPNVPHLRGLKAKQTPGFHFQATLKKSMWEFESNISDVLFVYVLLPFVFLWGRLGTVIMSRRAMSLMAQARWS